MLLSTGRFPDSGLADAMAEADQEYQEWAEAAAASASRRPAGGVLIASITRQKVEF